MSEAAILTLKKCIAIGRSKCFKWSNCMQIVSSNDEKKRRRNGVCVYKNTLQHTVQMAHTHTHSLANQTNHGKQCVIRCIIRFVLSILSFSCWCFVFLLSVQVEFVPLFSDFAFVCALFALTFSWNEIKLRQTRTILRMCLGQEISATGQC